VLLAVDDPENKMGAAIQMIQRRAAVKPYGSGADWNGSGKWLDLVISVNGVVSPIPGGRCWEK